MLERKEPAGQRLRDEGQAPRADGRGPRRLSLAPTLTLSLVGLTVVLAFIAALGVANLYSARQDYETALTRSYELESAVSRLLAAAVIEEAGLRTGAPARRHARRLFGAQAREALVLARGDPPSERLVRERIAAQSRARRIAATPGRRTRSVERRLAEAVFIARGIGDDLAARQRRRRAEARDDARGRTRTAMITAIGGGVLALLGSVTLIAALIGALRRPLDDLVTATQRLAAGDLTERVEVSGPLELQELGAAFNAMAEQLEEAQTRLETERVKLATTIESLGDALVVCDSRRTVTTVNPRVREIAPGLRPGASSHGPSSPLPRLDEALAGEVTVERDGRTLSVTAARLGPDDGGGEGGVVWTLRDISERARLERVKSDFVATASHELRSPLTSIKGFVELLARSESLGKREREFVDVILLSTDRLVDLVNDLLDVARLEAGKVDVHPRLFDLSEVVEEVAALMAASLDGKHQRLDLDLPPSLPRALADPAHVRRIVTNLLSNAHQYTDAGGRITISLSAAGGRLRLAVSDNGRGMSAEDARHVFDRFVRRDERTSGTGLGLAIVRSLVDLQGGSIEVDSAVGQGTTFTVHLPAEIQHGPAGVDARDALRGRCILVVGRSSLRGTLEPALLELGLDHEWATSAAAVSQACQRRAFDVALVDTGMRTPEAVLRTLVASHGGKGQSVILLRTGDEHGAPPPDGVEAVPLQLAARAALDRLMAAAERASPEARAE